MTNQPATIPATLIPGDGIGPEIIDATLKVLDALEAPFDWDVQQAGMAAFDASGEPLPKATLDSIRRTRLALKGPLTTPLSGGFRSINVAMRKEFQLFANVRPTRTYLAGGRYDDVDLVLIRENTEGLYSGFEHYIQIGDDPRAIAESTSINSRLGCERIARYAFDYAAREGRRKITVVHKANIMKVLTGLFLDIAKEVGKEYEGRIEFEDRIIDNCAMQLVINPWQFDMILTTNMFGDILSDEIAGLVGGLGLAPGGNIGHDTAIFEAVHGSAPDIAGQGVANPAALMLAAAMMLDHVEERERATRLRAALDRSLRRDGIATRDLGGTAKTAEFVDAVIERIE